MITGPRIFEIILFALINFAPYVILSVYTFYDQMRFSKHITGIVCIFLIFVQFLTRYWSALHNMSSSVHMSLMRFFVFLFGYAILFNIRFGKILFIELIFANIGNFIIIAAVYLERNFFPNTEHRLYCWHTSLMMFLLHIVLTLPFVFLIKRYFKPMISNTIVGTGWNYYWIVPAIFYFIWQYQINGGEETGLDIMLNPYNVIFLFIINIGSFLIYQLMIRLDGQLVINLELERKNHYLDMEALEYQLLEERIEDARRARHDVRHHMIVLADFLNAGNYEQLKEYLDHYCQTLPDSHAITFCPHRTINSVILYFAHQAKERLIDFQVQLSVPEQLPVADTDISVLLGNLLENALDACMEFEGEKRIIIHGNADMHSVFFTIDNTCGNSIQKNQKGQFLTTKKKGSGIGVESVKHIVERYNGVFTAEKKGEMFYVSFMLNL